MEEGRSVKGAKKKVGIGGARRENKGRGRRRMAKEAEDGQGKDTWRERLNKTGEIEGGERGKQET